MFFVNLLNLPQIDTDLTPYVVLNIEEPKHYRIKEELKNIFKEKNIVYSYHKPFPRIALFENAKIPDVRERLVSIEGLKEMQDKQIAFLASLLQ